MLRFLRRRDPDLAEDALSETFAVAVRRAADIPEGRELPWLYVVAEHVLRNLQRSRRRAARVPEALHPLTSHTTTDADLPHVGDALGELPDRERILLTMTAFEGLSATEAADRMGIPYGSARNALSSGRKRLAVVLAAAAAFVLVVGALGALVKHVRNRGPLQELASSLSSARIVHDVAVISHDDQTGPATGATARAAAGDRYERWSEGSGDRTRVRLPGGDEVVAARGETLRAAARQQVPGTAAPARRRAVREDLTALDAASPNAIAALLADPVAQRTAADGPTIAGHDTTTVRGRITDAAGLQHAVRVFVADDEPSVLRVRVRPVVPETASGATDAARRAAAPAATVDFVAWKATPRRAPAAPAASTPGAAAGVDVAPSTPPGASAAGAVPSGAGPAGDAAAAQAAAAGDGASTTNGPSRRRVSAPATAPAAPAGNPKLLSAPIVHVRQKVKSCIVDYSGKEYCIDYGDREVWFEQSGQQRSRSRAIRRTGQLRNEEWITSKLRNYFTVSVDGSRIRGMQEKLHGGDRLRRLPAGWRAQWLSILSDQVAALQADPARFAALPAGPDLGGRATRLFVTALHEADRGFAPEMPGTRTTTVTVDAATGAPLHVEAVSKFPPVTGSNADSSGSERVTLDIAKWDRVPAGYNAKLVTRRFPKGAYISRR